jgi:hypothetical protein
MKAVLREETQPLIPDEVLTILTAALHSNYIVDACAVCMRALTVEVVDLLCPTLFLLYKALLYSSVTMMGISNLGLIFSPIFFQVLHRAQNNFAELVYKFNVKEK